MSRMKTFGKYLILFLTFYIFVNFMSYELVKASYKNIEYKIQENELEINVEEAKASRESGKVKGKIKNITNNTLQNKYIKVEFISETGKIITCQYVDINQLKPEEQKEFTVRFRAENIKKINIDIVDKVEEKDINTVGKDIMNAIGLGFIAKIIVLAI